MVGWLRLEGAIQELFDVAMLPGIICPRALGPGTKELLDTVRPRLRDPNEQRGRTAPALADDPCRRSPNKTWARPATHNLAIAVMGAAAHGAPRPAQSSAAAGLAASSNHT